MTSSIQTSRPLIILGSNTPLRTDDVYILRDNRWKSRTILGQVRYRCGHRDQKIFSLNVYGREKAFSAEYFEPHRRDRCGDCCATYMKQEVIRCGLRGCPIFDKETVTLYTLPRDLSLMPHYAKVVLNSSDFSYEGAFLIGCINRTCMPSECRPSGTYKNKLYYPFIIGQPPRQIALWAHRHQYPHVFPVPPSLSS